MWDPPPHHLIEPLRHSSDRLHIPQVSKALADGIACKRWEPDYAGSKRIAAGQNYPLKCADNSTSVMAVATPPAPVRIRLEQVQQQLHYAPGGAAGSTEAAT